jgi:hypothetical protein
MFGVVPKALWERTNPADSQNLCTWAMRCLLVEDGDRLTLIDTGIGAKQDENSLATTTCTAMPRLTAVWPHRGFTATTSPTCF